MICLRPNFRGVGKSEGVHDKGQGEQQDLWATWRWAEAHFKDQVGNQRWAAGFSFGAAVTTHIVHQWDSYRSLQDLPDYPLSCAVLVGLAIDRFNPAEIDQRTQLIHGELDDVVTLKSVFDFAARYQRPVVVLPGAGHFFHGMLNELRGAVFHATALS